MFRHEGIHPCRGDSTVLAKKYEMHKAVYLLLWVFLAAAVVVFILLPSLSFGQTLDDYPLPAQTIFAAEPAPAQRDLTSMAIGDQYQTNDLLLRILKIHPDSPSMQHKPMCCIAFRDGRRFMNGLYMLEGQTRRIGRYELMAETVHYSPDGNGTVRLAIQRDAVPEVVSDGESKLSTTLAAARQSAITRSLRAGQSFRWASLALRLVRVNGSGYGESCTLIVRTPTQSATFTLEEFNSVFVENYEIVADSIRPSGKGRGSATLTVRYIPR